MRFAPGSCVLAFYLWHHSSTTLAGSACSFLQCLGAEPVQRLRELHTFKACDFPLAACTRATSLPFHSHTRHLTEFFRTNCMLLARRSCGLLLRRLTSNCKPFPLLASSCHSLNRLCQVPSTSRSSRSVSGLAAPAPLSVSMPSAVEAVELNRSDFNTQIKLRALRVPSKDIQKYMKLLRGWGTTLSHHWIVARACSKIVI